MDRNDGQTVINWAVSGVLLKGLGKKEETNKNGSKDL